MRKILLRSCELLAILLGIFVLLFLLNWLEAPYQNRQVPYNFNYIFNIEFVHLALLYVSNRIEDQENQIVPSQRFHLGRFVSFSLLVQSLVLLSFVVYLAFSIIPDQFPGMKKWSVLVLALLGSSYLTKWYSDRYQNYFFLKRNKKKSSYKGKEFFSFMIQQAKGKQVKGQVRGQAFVNQVILLYDQVILPNKESEVQLVAKGKIGNILLDGKPVSSVKDQSAEFILELDKAVDLYQYQLVMGDFSEEDRQTEYVNGLLKEVSTHSMDYVYLHHLFLSFVQAEFYQFHYEGEGEVTTVLYDKVFIPANNSYLKSIYTSPREAYRNQDLLELEGLRLRRIPFQTLLDKAREENMGIIINAFGTNRFVIDIHQFNNQMKELNHVIEVIKNVKEGK